MLIVIYFVLSTAFEAKISAFMINFPYAEDPHTLEDLFRIGYTIEQTDDTFAKTMIDQNSRIKQLFSTIEFTKLHKVDWSSRKWAYVGSRAHLYTCLHSPNNFDPATGRSRMVILD